MMSDNVILFPGVKRDAPPQTIEEIADKVTQTRKDHIEVVMHEIVPEMIQLFGAYGIDINSEEYIKDMSMVIESIHSMLNRQYKLHHPFHEIVDNIFDILGTDENGNITYAYQITDTKEDEE
jgi:RecB family endonuclease NucS